MSKHKKEFDKHLVIALQKLAWPLFDKNGKKVFVRSNDRKGDGFSHIASKHHSLKVRDIELIPSILKNPLAIKKDKRKGLVYYGKRKGINKSLYLKIVLREDKTEHLIIITICASKRLP